MPSKGSKVTAINERISEAQKARTRLACRVCRSRRIKCDGQKEICGRCKLDKRVDCSYENVGSVERIAGRQRKRALRKQHTTDESDSASESTETNIGVEAGPSQSRPHSHSMSHSHSQSLEDEGQLPSWTSPSLMSAQSSVLLSTSPQQEIPLIQNQYPQVTTYSRQSFQPPSLSSSSSNRKVVSDGIGDLQRRPVNLASLSSQYSSSNRGDETAYQSSSFLTSLPSSDSSVGTAATNSGFPGTSWVNMSPHLANQHVTNDDHHHHHHQAFLDSNQSIYPSTQSPDFQNSAVLNDPGSADSNWRVYDWQYRGDTGLPTEFQLDQPITALTSLLEN